MSRGLHFLRRSSSSMGHHQRSRGLPQRAGPRFHPNLRDTSIGIKQGSTVVNSIDVPRNDSKSVMTENGKSNARFPELATKISEEWKNVGSHRDPSDRKLDQAILHTDNKTEYYKIIGVIDAIYQTKRQMNVGGKTEPVPSFNVTFSVN